MGLGDFLPWVGRVLEDVPKRNHVEGSGRIVLFEHRPRADRQPVVLASPLAQPPVRLASVCLPPAGGGDVRKRSASGADVEQAAGCPAPGTLDKVETLAKRDFT